MEIVLLNLGIFSTLLLIYVAGVFLVAQWRSDNSVMDIAYGPAFSLCALGLLLLTKNNATLPWLITAAMGVWSLRLAVRIWRKNHDKPEDARYAAWRAAWTARGSVYFILRSFLQINLLQGVIITVVALPVVLAAAADATLSTITLLGGLVYLGGLAYESIADYQLDQFLARKRAGTEPATLMTTGLFHYSRRPNYFGETLIWWGLTIMVLPLPYGWLALASPLLITFIVTRVTGPMLEAIFLEKYPEEYRAYMASTSYFVPWFPKK